MTKPIIGITTGEIVNRDRPWSAYVYGQSYTYAKAIEDAGGTAILFPITADSESVDQLLELVDGVLLSGGNDINPAMYGEQLAGAAEISDARDAFEDILVTRLVASGKPLLAICRGMQMLNTIHGGTLYQDLASDGFGVYDHDGSSRSREDGYIVHDIQATEGSVLASIVGLEPLGANSRHHQAVKTLGVGLTIAATSDDGVVEAVELPGDVFRLGIQCHPESIYDKEPRWATVFDALVNAAKK